MLRCGSSEYAANSNSTDVDAMLEGLQELKEARRFGAPTAEMINTIGLEVYSAYGIPPPLPDAGDRLK